MGKKESIFKTSGLILALLSIFAIFWSMGLGENVFILALTYSTLSLALAFMIRTSWRGRK